MIKILAAEHVLPISSEPITDGAVAIETGEILDVGQAAEILAKYPSAETENFGKAAILPGFVNCHSHLELTAMRGALDHVEHDFRAWLLKINELRAGMTDADIARAAKSS